MSLFPRFLIMALSIASCTGSGATMKDTSTAKDAFAAHEENIIAFYNAGDSCDGSALVKDFAKDAKLFIQLGDLPSRELTGRAEIQLYYESACKFLHEEFDCFVLDIDSIEDFYFQSNNVIGNYGENDGVFHLCDGQDVYDKPQYFTALARLDKHGKYEIFHRHISSGAPLS